MRQSINVFIVAHNRILIEGVKAILNKPNYNIHGSAYNEKQALGEMKPEIDLLIIDQGITELENNDIIKKAKNINPDMNILAINGHNKADSIKTLIKSGANGHISRYVQETPLETAIATLMEKNGFLCELSTRIVAESLLERESKKNSVKLSKQEKKIIKLLALENRNSEIAKKLGISKRTVETHRKNIMRKIGAQNLAGVTMYAVRHGLVEV